MTNAQLYFAIGIPAIVGLINVAAMLVLFTDLSRRISALEDRVTEGFTTLTGAVNELDKRLTKVEIKLGIQP